MAQFHLILQETSRMATGIRRILNINYSIHTQRKLSSAVSAAGQEKCILDSCSIHPNCQEPRVIIVGAGMAGLSAAHRLTQCGIRNFVVLEAKERLVKIKLFFFYFPIYPSWIKIFYCPPG